MTSGRRESGEYDFLLAGGGLAGLSLAYRLVNSPLGDRKILILDRETKQQNDHTWCYWSCVPGTFDFLAGQTWDHLAVAHPLKMLQIPIAPYRYRMIRSVDFYRHVLADLASRENVSFRYGEVLAIRDGTDQAEVVTEEGAYRGKWVFNSLFRPGEFVPQPGRYLYLKQHFLGWEIETEKDAFDPGNLMLFDFRTPQSCGLWFFYNLPFTARRALVEFTVFSESLLAGEEYVGAVRHYLREVLGVGAYRILDEEKGVIPMTNQPFARRLGRRILATGTRGGRVKPSTGFAFRRIQSDSAAIVNSLLRHDDPFHLRADSIRYRWLDTVMLRVMSSCPDEMHTVYFRMFQANPISRVFRFLDEEGGVLENLRLMATLPKIPFTRAALGLR
jgi:lycopene beta-cyclase